MSNELEALERLKYIYAIDKETHRNDLNIIEQDLTPPTEKEVCKALSEWLECEVNFKAKSRF